MSKAIIDHGLSISIHHMMKSCAPNQGRFEKPTKCSGAWQWTSDGQTRATISYSIQHTSPARAVLELSYLISGEAITYSIQLAAHPCRFGGQRWFAFCPILGRKVCRIYLPNGAKLFLSRHAYRLAYQSQSDTAGFDRVCNQRNRMLFKKLKSTNPQSPKKPKWMRWKTFDGLLGKVAALEHDIDVLMAKRLNLPMPLFLS